MTDSNSSAGRMWSGRFDRGPDKLFDEFQRSFSFDRRLLPYEIAVDRAWAHAIEHAGILTSPEVQKLFVALDEIEKRASDEPAWLDASAAAGAEDIHHFVEMALIEKLGALGAKLHTGRSRNELIATDFRLFIKDASAQMRAALTTLISALVGQAERNIGTAMPGMTHMQHGQPILFAHFLLAHAEAFERDSARFAGAAESADACPMGSGALAGCAFAIDRAALAHELGFARATTNSLDAVSDRDFALEYLFAIAALGTHLSRLAEDFVLFASQEFGFIALPDEYATGSSLMPQKKNPDAWELTRGKTGRLVGALVSLLVTMKGLPTSYQRDLQEDKEPVFAAHDQALALVQVAAGNIAATRINVERMRELASDPSLLATDAADYLVRKGVPFRTAHEVVGKVLRDAEKRGEPWTKTPLTRLREFAPEFGADFHEALSVEASLKAHSVPGGTAPESVRAAIGEWRKKLSTLAKEEAKHQRISKRTEGRKMSAKHVAHEAATEAKKMSVAEQTQSSAPAPTPMNVPDSIPPRALPHGFKYATAACGLRRKNRLDLGMIVADGPCTAAGIFTSNLVKAAPVLLCQKHLASSGSKIRAIVVNSGNANCANGKTGMRASKATAKKTAQVIGCRAEQVLVCSTGVIGVTLPVEKILAALPDLKRTATDAPGNYDSFTQAIMTTDTRPKWAAATCRIGGKTIRLLGCAKGAGMIHPNMATMLAFLVTDASASTKILHTALKDVAQRTFNAITVDGDTSTNDTALLLASGASRSWGAPAISAGGRDYKAFVIALEKVCRKLALAIVSDGEGASRVVEIEVVGAPNDAAAAKVANTIATSPLVKTALAGGDPNWGRILAAAGRAGVPFKPERSAIRMAGIRVYDGGRALPFDEGVAHEKLMASAVPIEMNLRAGRGRARVWTCDFTAEYVHINASYRT